MADRKFTDADVTALADALKGHTSCNLGLTPEEVSILKRLLSAWNKATGIIGTLVLTAIVTALIAIFTKGFWISIAQGIRQPPR